MPHAYKRVKNGEKYAGEYVTTADPSSKKVICHGKDIVKIYEETQRMGYENPVIIYVPEPGVTEIYTAQDRHAFINTHA